MPALNQIKHFLMKKIAIDAADLCDARVDGTRIYIKNVLDHLGGQDAEQQFFIYLKPEINPSLDFKRYANYQVRQSKFPFFWTQLKLPFELKKDKPDVLWMPLQTVPYHLSKKLKVVVTIHDLAFHLFPDHFTKKDLFLLKTFTKKAIQRADQIIAVSQNTQKDLIKYYAVPEEKIKVVYHGYDSALFNPARTGNQEQIKKVKAKYKIKGDYLLYAGALQPRKNLGVLIKAFENLKKGSNAPDLRLVLAGGEAWLSERIFDQIDASPYKEDIIKTGPYLTEEMPFLLGGAQAFIFPSLYEGFGIPVLEAMAAGTPVITANNSSLTEVGGDAPLYFDAKNAHELAAKIRQLLDNSGLREELRIKGLKQAQSFSWEKCARETLAVLS